MNYRILTGEIEHEANTFSKVPTTLEHFRAAALLLGDEIPPARRGTRNTALGAAFEAAKKFGWTLSHPVAAKATPRGNGDEGNFCAALRLVPCRRRRLRWRTHQPARCDGR
ncbi:MAG: M81 family metallopeptidase [Mesorhizobium sp.]|nr:MAG: M81 family metallopeptidase [Mesorhizobium sp.]